MLDRLRLQLGISLGPETPVRDASGITFAVDDVVPASHPLQLSTLGDSLERRIGNRLIAMPDRELPALSAEQSFPGRENASRSDLLEEDPELQQALDGTADDAAKERRSRRGVSNPSLHPLLDAVHLAFSQHRPLVLSPDAIWLTVAQGFGHHIRENAGTLRRQIVRHEGKMQLGVMTFGPSLRWPDVVSPFDSLIQAHSDPVLYETLVCDFSTTTPTTRMASEIALMDVYQHYFEYTLFCVCGIPQITLEGTVSDWQRMRDRVEVLATYDLGWWISRLVPLLDQFVATAEGKPDVSFWRAVYKPAKAYAKDVATGWITDLFPYLGDGPPRLRNNMLESPRVDWIFSQLTDDLQPGYFSFGFARGVALSSFPSGLSRAPVSVKSLSGHKTGVDFMGGFFGVGQRAADNALFPLISWAVTSPDEADA